jgi:hypothetical protein
MMRGEPGVLRTRVRRRNPDDHQQVMSNLLFDCLVIL